MKNLFPIFILLLFSCQNLFQNDKSQSLEEAYQFGAPSVEKYWDADDYEKFSNYLSKISEDALPLYKSKKSGELFNRLINSISQDVFEDQNISINEKMEIAGRFIDATGRIVKRYGFSIMKNVDYSSEFAHLLGIVLTNFNQINPLLNDFLKTIDKHDETYEIRMEGLDQFKNGVFKTIKGTLICLTEPHIYQKSDRLLMANNLVNEGVPIILELKKKFQIEIKNQLVKVLDMESDKRIFEKLSEFSKAIN